MDYNEFNKKYPLKLNEEKENIDKKDSDNTQEKKSTKKKTKIELNPKLDGDVI